MPWKKRINNNKPSWSTDRIDRFTEKEGVVIFLIFGIIFRLYWVWAQDIPSNSDASIIYLMAKHILQGKEFPFFYYGQAYSSAFTSYILAGFFYLFGVGDWTVKFYIFLSGSLFHVLLIFMIQSVINKKTAFWSAVYCMVLPVTSYKFPIEYTALLIISVLFLWILAVCMQKRDRYSNIRIALLGIISGIGWYIQPLFCYLLALFFAVMAIRIIYIAQNKLKMIEQIFVWSICFCLGSGLYWIGIYKSYTLHNPLIAFGGMHTTSFGTNLLKTISQNIPAFFCFDHRSIILQFFGVFIYMSIAIISLFSLKTTLKKWKQGYFRARLLFQLLFIGMIFMFSYHNTASDIHAIRYLVLLVVVWPVLVADVIEKIPKRVKYLKYIFACIFIIYNSYTVFATPLRRGHNRPLIQFLTSQNYIRGFADYWTAYKLVFFSNEHLLISPFWGVDRYPKYTNEIIQSDDAFYLFDTKNKQDNIKYTRFKKALQQAGVTYKEDRLIHYTVLYSLKIMYGGQTVLVRYFTPIYEELIQPTQNKTSTPFRELRFTLSMPAGSYTFITAVSGSVLPDVKPDYPVVIFAPTDIVRDSIIAKLSITNGEFKNSHVITKRFTTVIRLNKTLSFRYLIEYPSIKPDYLIVL